MDSNNIPELNITDFLQSTANIRRLWIHVLHVHRFRILVTNMKLYAHAVIL